ncbi:MAG: GIY-YIG nuclease family protein [Lachnospiraceae bacterium]|nr:GIY-YIG nuclease family protein [Lachnospiraceae bacterium]
MHRGRIVQLDEYWGENVEAPQWRTEAQIGTRIDRRRKKRKAEAPVEKTVEKPAETNYTYLLRCADGSLYAGWTNDLEKRLEAHQSGKGGKYTKAHLPVELVYHETFDTKEEAMRREYELKQMTKAQKEALVQGTI